MGVIFTALGESRVEVTYLVYIGYMIKDIFYQVANVLIVAIIARTITEDVGALSQKLTSFGIGFLWTISLIVLGFDIAVYAEYLAIGGAEEIAGRGFLYSSMILASYLFAFTLVLSALAVFAVLKGRSMVRFNPSTSHTKTKPYLTPCQGSLLMLIIVMPSLFLTTLLELVTEAATNFRSGRPTKSSYDLIYANLYISVLAIMAIFLTVALIGGLRQRHSDASGLTQEQKLAQTGPHYVAVGPYAPPTAPYNPHGTQFYSPPVYGGQQMQYAPYAAPGQFATQQQQAEMSNTPAPAVAKTASPVQYAAPVAVSPSPYGAPSSSSVSPPPQHDPYQAYTQQQPQQQQHQ